MWLSDEAPSAEQQTTLFPTRTRGERWVWCEGLNKEGQAQGKARQGKARSRADGLDRTGRRGTSTSSKELQGSVRAGVCKSDRRYLESRMSDVMRRIRRVLFFLVASFLFFFFFFFSPSFLPPSSFNFVSCCLLMYPNQGWQLGRGLGRGLAGQGVGPRRTCWRAKHRQTPGEWRAAQAALHGTGSVDAAGGRIRGPTLGRARVFRETLLA